MNVRCSDVVAVWTSIATDWLEQRDMLT